MIFRARTVVSMEGPPIEDGAVAVRGNRILAVGSFRDVSRLYPGKSTDLGEQVLLPGLINAHCHLDYTIMRKAILYQNSFTRWVSRINALKRCLGEDDYLKSIAAGFDELKKWGTTTVLNIESFPELMSKMPAPPIRTWWFYEMIDLRHRIATEELVAGAFVFFQERPDWLGGFGLSPHAPYTASDELYRLANECARVTGMPLTTHLGESAEEDLMYREGRGNFYDFLAGLGRNMDDCGHGSALAGLLKKGLIGPDWLLVHLNELSEEDFGLMEGRKLNIVHCPESHRYFKHSLFQHKRLHDLGMNICLGTDSLASNEGLNLFAEMRAVQNGEPWMSPEEVLKTVTVNAAKAFGREDSLGKIAPGACADMIALPFNGDVSRVYETIVQNRKPVGWMMVDGRI
jgi:cytosine/adenosine deaminase-related metal-dependent hydrolase